MRLSCFDKLAILEGPQQLSLGGHFSGLGPEGVHGRNQRVGENIRYDNVFTTDCPPFSVGPQHLE